MSHATRTSDATKNRADAFANLDTGGERRAASVRKENTVSAGARTKMTVTTTKSAGGLDLVTRSDA